MDAAWRGKPLANAELADALLDMVPRSRQHCRSSRKISCAQVRPLLLSTALALVLPTAAALWKSRGTLARCACLFGTGTIAAIVSAHWPATGDDEEVASRESDFRNREPPLAVDGLQLAAFCGWAFGTTAGQCKCRLAAASLHP